MRGSSGCCDAGARKDAGRTTTPTAPSCGYYACEDLGAWRAEKPEGEAGRMRRDRLCATGYRKDGSERGGIDVNVAGHLGDTANHAPLAGARGARRSVRVAGARLRGSHLGGSRGFGTRSVGVVPQWPSRPAMLTSGRCRCRTGSEAGARAFTFATGFDRSVMKRGSDVAGEQAHQSQARCQVSQPAGHTPIPQPRQERTTARVLPF